MVPEDSLTTDRTGEVHSSAISATSTEQEVVFASETCRGGRALGVRPRGQARQEEEVKGWTADWLWPWHVTDAGMKAVAPASIVK